MRINQTLDRMTTAEFREQGLDQLARLWGAKGDKRRKRNDVAQARALPAHRQSTAQEKLEFNFKPYFDATEDGLLLRLMIPPSTNVIWRMAGDHMAISKAGRQYYRSMKLLYQPFLQHVGWDRSGEFFLAVTIQPQQYPKNYSQDTHPRLDIDNYLKPVIDCMKNLAYDDDRQITGLSVELARPEGKGCVWLYLSRGNSDWYRREVAIE